MAKKDTAAAGNDNDITPAPEHLRKLDWDATGGDEFGGDSEILGLEENEVAGPLTYVTARHNVDLGNGMGAVTMHEARDDEKNVWRLPIASSFRRQAEAANLKTGDKFAIKRLEDAVKKHGKGKGNAMEMYAIKIISRAATAEQTVS